MIKVHAPFNRTMTVPASPKQVFALLADVPDSVAHFPDVESLVFDNGGYTWRLTKAGLPGFQMEIIYACRYVSDTKALTVKWTPIVGVGNSLISGHWTIEPSGEGSRVTITNELIVSVPLPKVARKVAEPVTVRENERRMTGYLDNLATTFRGGDGRVR